MATMKKGKRMFLFFGPPAKYESLSWWDNFASGHWTVGPVTLFGANAMNWTFQIKTKRWGYICIRLLNRRLGWYIYASPNGTPWACTFYIGSDKNESMRARIRRMNFGHNFDSQDAEMQKKLYALNHKFGWFLVNEYDVYKFGDKDED